MSLCRLAAGLCGITLVMMTIPATLAYAQAGTDIRPPAYRLNRADEDYNYLRDPARHTDVWDAIKYVPFNEPGRWYLSLGGEARERYEYFNHPKWGADPQDHGYLLQRYFLHGDVHMGECFRLFAQLQSSLESGREGGPRPADRDELDLHQAFLDAKFPFLVRSGRNSTARYIGSQPQAQLQWNIDRHITFNAIYAHFFAGPFLKETGSAKDVDYFTAWMTYKF